MFFFEKKNQKTFPALVSATGRGPGSNGKKFFASFFHRAEGASDTAKKRFLF
jgi:hypothetical protein